MKIRWEQVELVSVDVPVHNATPFAIDYTGASSVIVARVVHDVAVVDVARHLRSGGGVGMIVNRWKPVPFKRTMGVALSEPGYLVHNPSDSKVEHGRIAMTDVRYVYRPYIGH